MTAALDDVTDAFREDDDDDVVVTRNSNSSGNNSYDENLSQLTTNDSQETSVWNVDGELVEYPDLHFR